jgi:hypothetical protein
MNFQSVPTNTTRSLPLQTGGLSPRRMLECGLMLAGISRCRRATKEELVQIIEYLKVENRILRSKLPQWIETTPAERALLLKLGVRLGTKLKCGGAAKRIITAPRVMKKAETTSSPPHASCPKPHHDSVGILCSDGDNAVFRNNTISECRTDIRVRNCSNIRMEGRRPPSTGPQGSRCAATPGLSYASPSGYLVSRKS